MNRQQNKLIISSPQNIHLEDHDFNQNVSAENQLKRNCLNDKNSSSIKNQKLLQLRSSQRSNTHEKYSKQQKYNDVKIAATQAPNALRSSFKEDPLDLLEQQLGGSSVNHQNPHHQRNNMGMLKQSAENNAECLLMNKAVNMNQFHSLGQNTTNNEKMGKLPKFKYLEQSANNRDKFETQPQHKINYKIASNQQNKLQKAMIQKNQQSLKGKILKQKKNSSQIDCSPIQKITKQKFQEIMNQQNSNMAGNPSYNSSQHPLNTFNQEDLTADKSKVGAMELDQADHAKFPLRKSFGPKTQDSANNVKLQRNKRNHFSNDFRARIAQVGKTGIAPLNSQRVSADLSQRTSNDQQNLNLQEEFDNQPVIHMVHQGSQSQRSDAKEQRIKSNRQANTWMPFVLAADQQQLNNQINSLTITDQTNNDQKIQLRKSMMLPTSNYQQPDTQLSVSKSSMNSSQFTEPFSRRPFGRISYVSEPSNSNAQILKLNPSQIKYADQIPNNGINEESKHPYGPNSLQTQPRTLQQQQHTFSRNNPQTESSIGTDKNANEPNNMGQIQKVKLRVSKLNNNIKFSTPEEQVSKDMSPCKEKDANGDLIEDCIDQNDQYPQRNSNLIQDNPYPKRGAATKFNIHSPSSIKVIDLRQPKIRKLLMDSLQEIVKDRQHRFHQRESKQFNVNYQQIINDTMNNRSLKIEKQIPDPIIENDQEYAHPFGSDGESSIHQVAFSNNGTFFQLEQQIISKGNLQLQLKQNANSSPDQNIHPNSSSQSRMGLPFNYNAQAEEPGEPPRGSGPATLSFGRMTQSGQLQLFEKLNKIYEEQKSEQQNQIQQSQQQFISFDGKLNISDNLKNKEQQSGSNESGFMKESHSEQSQAQEHSSSAQIQDQSSSDQKSGNDFAQMFPAFSAINNDCQLLYIANSSIIQYEDGFAPVADSNNKTDNNKYHHYAVSATNNKQINEETWSQRRIRRRLANKHSQGSSTGSMSSSSFNKQSQDSSDEGQLLYNSNMQNEEFKMQGIELKDDFTGNYSRNNHQMKINKQKNTNNQKEESKKQIYNDQPICFQNFEEITGSMNQSHLPMPDQRSQKISKKPSVQDLTFFDLSNPQHLNKLFSRLEEIQKQESSNNSESRELPKVVQKQERQQQLEEESKHNSYENKENEAEMQLYKSQESQSGDASSSLASPELSKAPVQSRQGIEQHQIDMDLLIQKLLQIPNVDVLDSIFNTDKNDQQDLMKLNLQPSNGSNDLQQSTYDNQSQLQRQNEKAESEARSIQQIQQSIGDLVNDKPQVGESMSSGGRASEIQSSGIMTPRSQNSLSTPNQIKMLQERNFNIQGFKFPINNQNNQSGMNSHDLTSPFTKKILMQKLKEVKEQIGDSDSDSSNEDIENRNIVDGVVAGSVPDPQIFAKPKKEPKNTDGTIVQKAIGNDRNQKTKLIISQIDEEDENLQKQEDEELIELRKSNLVDKTKVNSLVSPSPRMVLSNLNNFENQNQSQVNPIQSNPNMNQNNNFPQIDQLINKLKQLETQQRMRESQPNSHQGSQSNLNIIRDSINGSRVSSGGESPVKVGNINIYNMPSTLPPKDFQRGMQVQIPQKPVSANSQNDDIIHQPYKSESKNDSLGERDLSSPDKEMYLSHGLDLSEPQIVQTAQFGGYNQQLPQSSVLSRNQSVANILEQVIKRLEKLKTGDESQN